MLEEWERELGGRVKTVLVLALAASLLVQYNKSNILELRPVQGSIVQNGDIRLEQEAAESMEDNPIDRYFAEREAVVPAEQLRQYRLVWLECWEEELRYAYERLGEALPSSFWEQDGYLGQAREHFRNFVRAEGYLESYYEMHGEQGIQTAQEQGKPGADVTGLEVQLTLTREQTLRIHALIREQQGLSTQAEKETEEQFTFEREAAEAMLKRVGL